MVRNIFPKWFNHMHNTGGLCLEGVWPELLVPALSECPSNLLSEDLLGWGGLFKQISIANTVMCRTTKKGDAFIVIKLPPMDYFHLVSVAVLLFLLEVLIIGRNH